MSTIVTVLRRADDDYDEYKYPGTLYSGSRPAPGAGKRTLYSCI